MRRIDLSHLIEELDVDFDAPRRAAMEAAVPWAEFLAEVRRGAPGPWARHAACKGQTDLMYPERGTPATAAYDLCSGCTVAQQCAAWADEHGCDGIAAGETGRNRRRRLNAERRAA